MKKLFLTVLAAAVVTIPALRAQDLTGVPLVVEKVNVGKLKGAIAKSDAEIADAKKAAKAATWLKRGDVFLDADTKPVNGLFVGLDEAMIKQTFGEPILTENVKLGGTDFTVYTYEHFKLYLAGGKIAFYLPVTVVDANALDKAYDAYAKAYEIDAKSEKKVNIAMTNIRNRSLEYGNAYYNLSQFKASADNFRRAYKASAHPSVNNIDTLSLFYAGNIGTIAGDYEAALQDLNKAIDLGYESNGEAYYYKFHCLYNLNDVEGALETLKYAVGLYPGNNDILEGLLTLYSTGDEDPTNIIPMVLNAIKQNPDNAGLYLGLARVYDKLGQVENSIEAATKAVELNPEDFYANYFKGLFIVKRGDEMDAELRSMTITSRTQYQTALDAVNAKYAEALEPLEKAYALDSSEISTVDLLKKLTFRLREMPGIDVKYEQYDGIYKKMSEEE